MQILGRLLVRKNGVAGLFLPFGKDNKLKPGLYNVVEIMGETGLKFVGKPVLRAATLNGLDLEGLMNCRPMSVVTAKEMKGG